MTAASVTPNPNTVPKSDGSGILDRAWLEGDIAIQHEVAGAVVTAPHNATTALIDANPAVHTAMFFRYTVVRGTRFRVGTLAVLVHATTPNVADVANTEVGTSGVTFTATASGGITTLNAVVSNADSVNAIVNFVGEKLELPA